MLMLAESVALDLIQVELYSVAHARARSFWQWHFCGGVSHLCPPCG